MFHLTQSLNLEDQGHKSRDPSNSEFRDTCPDLVFYYLIRNMDLKSRDQVTIGKWVGVMNLKLETQYFAHYCLGQTYAPELANH